VLAQVAFPRIRSFGSSAAPRRVERVRASGPRPPVDLPALAAALAEAGGAAFDGSGGEQAWDLERRLRQREQDLAAALARIAGLKAALQAPARQIEA